MIRILNALVCRTHSKLDIIFENLNFLLEKNSYEALRFHLSSHDMNETHSTADHISQQRI